MKRNSELAKILPLASAVRLCLLLVGLAAALSAPGSARAENLPVYEIAGSGSATAEVVSIGSYRSIEIRVTNNASTARTISFPYGSHFKSADQSYQDLAVVFPENIDVAAGKSATVRLKTTCMDASKGVAPAGYKSWTPKLDAALGDLLRFYDVSRPMVEAVTGPEHHNTPEKRHNFLQLLVWTYYGADKGHMTSFATTYMFDGDRAAASRFVDSVYPLAKMTLDAYKAGNRSGLPLPF